MAFPNLGLTPQAIQMPPLRGWDAGIEEKTPLKRIPHLHQPIPMPARLVPAQAGRYRKLHRKVEEELLGRHVLETRSEQQLGAAGPREAGAAKAVVLLA